MGKENRETRIFEIDSLELRQGDGDGDTPPTLAGHAAVFDSLSEDLGGFREKIEPGAFKRTLEEQDTIHSFWSHDSAIPLGATSSGRLNLSEDKQGLAFELDGRRLTPQQLDAVEAGEMRMSFGFSVPKGGDDWDDDEEPPVRTLTDVTLHEVSLVALPAYPDTSVAVRKLEQLRDERATANVEAEDSPDPPFELVEDGGEPADEEADEQVARGIPSEVTEKLVELGLALDR